MFGAGRKRDVLVGDARGPFGKRGGSAFDAKLTQGRLRARADARVRSAYTSNCALARELTVEHALQLAAVGLGNGQAMRADILVDPLQAPRAEMPPIRLRATTSTLRTPRSFSAASLAAFRYPSAKDLAS